MTLSLLRLRRVWLANSLMAAAVLAVLVSGVAPWIGDDLWGQEVIGRGQLLVLPLLSGFGAWWGRKDAQGIWTLMASLRLRWRHLINVVGAQAIGVAGVYAAAHTGVLVVSRFSDLHFDNSSGWPFLTHIAAATLAFLTGYTLGLTLHSYVAVAVAAALWPLLIVGEKSGLLTGAFSELGASGTMAGYQPEPLRFGLRALWLCTLTVVVVLIAVHEAQRSSLAVIALILLALGSVAIPQGDGFRATTAAQTCVGQPIELCGPREIRPRLIQAATVVNAAGQVLREHGVRTPETYVAWTARTDLDHENWVRVFSPGRIRDALKVEDLVSDVVAPRSCALWYGMRPPSEAWMNGADLVSGHVQAALESAGSASSVNRDSGVTVGDSAVWTMATALQDCDEAAVPTEIPGARE